MEPIPTLPVVPSLLVVVAAVLAGLVAAGFALVWRRERSRRLAAERQAAAAAHRLAGATAAMREAMSVYDAAGRPAWINPAFERFTGFTLEELAERPALDYVHAEERAALLARWPELQTAGAALEAEYRITTRWGEQRWAAGVWTARLDPQGRVDGCIGVETDVTARRRADETLQRDAALFQTIAEAQQAIGAAGLDSTAVMHAIAERSRALTAAAGASIEEVQGDWLVTRVASGVAAERVPLGASLSGLAVRTGALQRSDDAIDDRRVDRATYMPLAIRSLLVLPLPAEGRTTHVLKVVSLEARAFGEREERVLQLLAGLMGAALRHAAVFELRQQRLEERTRALQESEQRFKQLVDAAQEGIWVLDDRGVTTYVNHRMAELLGHPNGDILGRPLADFLDAASRAEVQRGLAERPAGPRRLDLRFRRKDGADLWTIVATSPILARDGAFVGTVGLVTDITERKRAEDQLRRSAERLRTLHDIDQAVLAARSPAEIARAALGRLKRLVPVQRCSITLFDFAHDQVQVVAGYTGGLPLAALPIPLSAFSSPEVLRRGVVRYVEDLASLEPRPPLYEQLLGEGVRSLLSVPLLVDGEAIGELNLGLGQPGAVEPEHRDIAVEVAAPLAIAIQHARLRDELRRRTAELERRIAERSAELQEAVLELEGFAHAIGHDLRAPLRHVHGFIQLLLAEHGRRLDEPARHYAERVRDAARDLGTMMDALLLLARVSRQDLLRRPTPLDAVVEEVLLQLQPEWEERQIDWQVDALPTVDCDPALARLAVEQLVSNAVKFTRPRSRACIRIAAARQEGLAGLLVQDNGIGFRMTYADKLFGTFQRLHPSEAFEGAGIGLALVRRIAERHGGRAWAEGEPDQGATVHLLLGPETGA
ncbi:MAG TPA: PAS domain S-box protein [Gemmatimonadales bacterium]|nr:PAS domain S-box protein [Gemmatimonadales bacterium]